MVKGFEAGAKVVVYAQNWAYLLGMLPEGVSWKDLARSHKIEFMAVSEPVAWFMRQVLGLELDKILPPVVRECFFREAERRKTRVRVAWMPRKNGALAKQILQIAGEVLRRADSEIHLESVEINRMAQEEVAATLASCHIFLASSLTEGFGLPPVEAMASGCVPVGFAGLGGWEYMRSSPLSPCHAQVVSSLPSGLALPEKPWGPNGFYAPEGDTVSAGLALAEAVRQAAANSPAWLDLRNECRKTAKAYDKDAMLKRLLQGVFPAL
jgi:glycosyltransferase involved in cell wall biosynthesis